MKLNGGSRLLRTPYPSDVSVMIPWEEPRVPRVRCSRATAPLGGERAVLAGSPADPTQYAEAVAMRLPDFHPLALALIDQLGLRRRLFYNVDIKPGIGSGTGTVPPVDRPDFRAPEQALRTCAGLQPGGEGPRGRPVTAGRVLGPGDSGLLCRGGGRPRPPSRRSRSRTRVVVSASSGGRSRGNSWRICREDTSLRLLTSVDRGDLG